MKTKPLTFLLALTFLFLFSGSSVVFGDNFQDGWSAYEKKDYETALLPSAGPRPWDALTNEHLENFVKRFHEERKQRMLETIGVLIIVFAIFARKAISSAFSKYFQGSGRSSRSEYWFFCFFLLFVEKYLAFFDERHIAASIFVLATLIPFFTVCIRRFHDIGRSGWWMYIPFTVIGIIPFFYWMCKKGDEGENPYGSDPLAPFSDSASSNISSMMVDFLSKNRFLKKIRNSFSTEFMWRCYVVTQGAFLLIMIGLADDYISGTDLKWYFFFPRIEYDELDEAQWWIGVLYYFIIPYVIVRTVDWVLQSKKSD